MHFHFLSTDFTPSPHLILRCAILSLFMLLISSCGKTLDIAIPSDDEESFVKQDSAEQQHLTAKQDNTTAQETPRASQHPPLPLLKSTISFSRTSEVIVLTPELIPDASSEELAQDPASSPQPTAETEVSHSMPSLLLATAEEEEKTEQQRVAVAPQKEQVALEQPRHVSEKEEESLQYASETRPEEVASSHPRGDVNNPQCSLIYPDMLKVATPIFRSVMALNPSAIPDHIGRRTAQGTQIMLANMISSARPIHPVAFFSTIKHFESPGHTHGWGHWDFRFTSTHCLSWECSGYFQVDVHIEPDWSLEHVCGKNGLDILGMKGGPDFCAALFWWTQAANGTKCQHLAAPSGVNPCWDEGYNWDVGTFEAGYLAYGQGNQWGIYDTWGRAYSGGMVGGKYFMGYENCAAQYYVAAPTPKESIKKAVLDFARTIGFHPHWADEFTL